MLARPDDRLQSSGRQDFEVSHEGKFQSSLPLSPCALAISQDWLAFQAVTNVRHKVILTLVRLATGSDNWTEGKHLIETQHQERIEAACFGQRAVPCVLVTASKDSVRCLRLPAEDCYNQKLKSELVKEDLGQVCHLSLDAADKWIAASAGNLIYVVELETGRTICLEGHLARVTASEFLLPAEGYPQSKDWLVSISEDRTFKVWDVANRCCLYQSTILSPYPLTSVAIDPDHFRCCIGSEDGLLRFFELTPRRGNACEPRCLTTIDISKTFRQMSEQTSASEPVQDTLEIISSIPRWRSKIPRSESAIPDDKRQEIHYSPAIVASCYCTLLPSWAQRSQALAESDALRMAEGGGVDRVRLIVGCVNGAVIIDPVSYTILCRVSYQESYPPSTSTSPTKDPTLLCAGFSGTAGAYALPARWASPNTCAVLVGNSFSGESNLILIREKLEQPQRFLPGSDGTLQSVVRTAVELNVQRPWSDNILRDCLVQLSKLNIRSVEDVKAAGEIQYPSIIPSYVQTALALIVKGDQIGLKQHNDLAFEILAALPFHPSSPLKTKAKPTTPSCTSKPINAKGRSKTNGIVQNKPVTFHAQVKSSGYSEKSTSNRLFGRKPATRPAKRRTDASEIRYPCDSEPPVKPDKLPPAVNHSKPITCVKFNASGSACATASSDGTARYHRTPLSSETHMKDLMGHNGPLTTVSWSQSSTSQYGQLLLTASLDGSARLWTVKQSEPLLEFRKVLGNRNPKPKVPPLTAKVDTKQAFSSEIRHARFYYNDQFILIPSGPDCNLYTYHLERPDKGSVRPQLNYNWYKLASKFSSSAHSLTALACMNARKSHLILTACSDKQIHVWDVARCSVVRSIRQAQTRVIHALALADYEHPSPAFENVFVSTAVTDSIKCWDLRQERAILHLHGHCNRYAQVGCALSPCGRYIASGSEDNHAYLYDVRKSAVLERLPGHTDVVSSVDFNPLYPKLATGCHDGKLRFFTS
ncbi:hypothetical protein SpCBS45565_g02904 [Spizellomyces sp. 'palustris']|nr:hypothetical protein SpCBS45565_g02904 [Spizellomyces sp. 'palustris']